MALDSGGGGGGLKVTYPKIAPPAVRSPYGGGRTAPDNTTKAVKDFIGNTISGLFQNTGVGSAGFKTDYNALYPGGDPYSGSGGYRRWNSPINKNQASSGDLYAQTAAQGGGSGYSSFNGRTKDDYYSPVGNAANISTNRRSIYDNGKNDIYNTPEQDQRRAQRGGMSQVTTPGNEPINPDPYGGTGDKGQNTIGGDMALNNGQMYNIYGWANNPTNPANMGSGGGGSTYDSGWGYGGGGGGSGRASTAWTYGNVLWRI